MWDLPRPGLEPVSPASADRFSTTAPPGKPKIIFYLFYLNGGNAQRHQSDSLKSTTAGEFTPRVWANSTNQGASLLGKPCIKDFPLYQGPNRYLKPAWSDFLSSGLRYPTLSWTPHPTSLSGTAHSVCPRQTHHHPPKLPHPLNAYFILQQHHSPHCPSQKPGNLPGLVSLPLPQHLISYVLSDAHVSPPVLFQPHRGFPGSGFIIPPVDSAPASSLLLLILAVSPSNPPPFGPHKMQVSFRSLLYLKSFSDSPIPKIGSTDTLRMVFFLSSSSLLPTAWSFLI